MLGAIVSTIAALTQQVATAPARPQEPAPVSVALRIVDGRRQFRPGEIIPIQLEFNSSIPKRFAVDGATYDRSGRLTIDEFRIEPNDAVVDPLLDYLASAGGFMGGGIRGIHVLGEKPAIVTLELNDWFRFDTPGTYHLSIRSRRVTDETERSDQQQRPVVPVESNTVQFEILPRDTHWEESELAAALRILDSDAPDVDRRKGCRMLRSLGTDAAVDEMVRRFADERWGCEFEYMVGLFGAPNRERAVRQMEARLGAGDQPITATYLRTLGVLALYLRHPEFRPPQTRDAKGAFPRSGSLGARQDLIGAAVESYADMLSAALPQKTGRARAESAMTVMNAPGRRQQGGDAIAPVFPDLPPERQRSLLEYEWRTFGGPAMLPVLRELCTSSAPDLADVALRRLYELDEPGGRARILEAIANPPLGATLRTLGVLPDRELPQLDDALAANIEPGVGFDALSIRAELLHRYASGAVSARVLAKTSDRLPVLACRPKAALLAYFLRAEPAVGRTLLDDALAARAATGCYRAVLYDVAKLRMTPALEAAALAHLDDPDPEVAASAVRTLSDFGSPAAREPLRRRFERWHDEWAGKASVLRPSLLQESTYGMEAMLESALYSALARGRAWAADADDLQHLRELCVTDGCRTQVGYFVDRSRSRTIRIARCDDPEHCVISVAQYELRSLASLEEKLAQYPRGTAFTLNVAGLDPATAAAVSTRVTAAAAIHGVTVRR